VADIYSIWKESRLGPSSLNIPPRRHVEALMKLGFEEMVLPDDTRYRLTRWGIRKVRD
jgi:hypothetical protein